MSVSTVPAESTARAGFRALNAFFDRVLVITLPRATARHDHLVRALDGLEYELFHGQDKHDLSMDDLIARGVYDPKRARRLHRLGREMNLGQIACALSHIAVWRQVAAGPHRRVLVLEDDAVPVQEIATVGDTLAELPPSWELLYLGYNRNEVVTPRLRANQIAYMCLAAFRIGSLSVREASNLLPRPHSARLRRAGFHDETHAYALTPAAAERLLRFQRPIGLNVDSAITRVILREEIEAYVADPKVFYQSGAASLIHAADPGGRPGGTRAEAHSPWVAPAG